MSLRPRQPRPLDRDSEYRFGPAIISNVNPLEVTFYGPAAAAGSGTPASRSASYSPVAGDLVFTARNEVDCIVMFKITPGG